METGRGDQEQSWRPLSLLQSTDIVREKFRQKHTRTLNLQRSREIATCFVQGIHYFMNARAASEVVKPLLLYYGVLSLSRGLILFLDPRKKEEALAQSHGLVMADWQNTLSNGTDFTALGVKETKGTFQELIRATRNELAFRVTGPFARVIERCNRLEVGARSDGIITLSDLLARTIDLRVIYEQCTGSPSRAIPCLVSDIGRFNIQLLGGSSADLDAETLRQRLGVVGNVDVQIWKHPSSNVITVRYDGNGSDFYLPHLEPSSKPYLITHDPQPI